MPEPTLYLFDGHNLLHAGDVPDPRALRDRLASFVAVRGARGVLVFDGRGADETHGPLDVRYAEHADALIERLAAEHRDGERVCVVSSDAAVRTTAGQEVSRVSSRHFLLELGTVVHTDDRPHRSAIASVTTSAPGSSVCDAATRSSNTRSYQVGSLARGL